MSNQISPFRRYSIRAKQIEDPRLNQKAIYAVWDGPAKAWASKREYNSLKEAGVAFIAGCKTLGSKQAKHTAERPRPQVTA
tara:strand:+ start:479 stop:721 length:243 start_codon:yes stop_codon:yes gene_type:complete